jgi:hypothetical protein
MPFRRREPLHERLAREGGMRPPPEDPGPHWGEVGIHGVPRLREWDAVLTAEAPDLSGDEVSFVALPDGSLLVEQAGERDDLTPLADAVEGSVAPPYRAEAVRRTGQTWAVGVRSIDVVELPDDVPGDAITLTVHGGVRDLLVDGERSFGSFGSFRALEEYAGARFASYSLDATRLDETLWEVRVAPL